MGSPLAPHSWRRNNKLWNMTTTMTRERHFSIPLSTRTHKLKMGSGSLACHLFPTHCLGLSCSLIVHTTRQNLNLHVHVTIHSSFYFYFYKLRNQHVRGE